MLGSQHPILLMQGFSIDDTELKEYTHLMLSNVAEALGQSFAPYLPAAIEGAYKSLSEADTGSGAPSEDGSVSLNSQEDSDIDEAEQDHERRQNLHTGN